MHDPRFKDEIMGLRITHAVRAKIQDDIKGMTAAERTAYFHEGSKAAFERLGFMPKYVDLSRKDS